MSTVHIYREALVRARDEIEGFNPQSLTLAYINGLLAVGRKSGNRAGRKVKQATDEDRALRAGYEAGKSILHLVNEFNRSPAMVRSAILRAGGAMRGRGRKVSIGKPKNFDVFKERFNAGLTLEAIATEYGITRERVRQVLLRGGVDTSPRLKPLTEREIEAAQKYAAGENLSVCAVMAGVCDPTFKNSILPRAGVALRKRTRAGHDEMERRIDQVSQLHSERLTAKEISLKLGIPISTVYRDMWSRGISPNNARAA